MKHLGVAELKNRLSRYLREVAAGLEVEVTDRRRPVPRGERMRPIRVSTRPFATLRARTYAAAGWARSSTELLLEERRDR